MQARHHEADVPAKGQRFVDSSGKYWRVADRIHSDVLDGFFIVRLIFGSTAEREEDSWVLGRSEFQALYRECGLQPVHETPCVSNVVVLPTGHAAANSDDRAAA